MNSMLRYNIVYCKSFDASLEIEDHCEREAYVNVSYSLYKERMGESIRSLGEFAENKTISCIP